MLRKSRLVIAATAAAAAFAVPTSASAQVNQDGLVNVNVSDNVVQVPIGIAANVCGVSVAVLANVASGPVDCTTTAESGAVSAERNDGGDARQRGLVNLNVEDNVLQVPVAVAANICGVGVGVLAQQVSGPVECDARSRSRAEA